MNNIFSYRRIHCVGIKGAGVAALAQILASRGCVVSGSDVSAVFFTDDALRHSGITIYEDFDASHVIGCDAVIYSTAYDPVINKELRAAAKNGIPLMPYHHAVGLLTHACATIAVCGTHGKTTTTALTALLLAAGDRDPLSIVGGNVPQWGSGARCGKGKYFVLEADEYQEKFLAYHPLIAILTSVDWDHPDYFPTVTEYENAFRNFCALLPNHGTLIANGDDSAVRRVIAQSPARIITYGRRSDNDVIIDVVRVEHHADGQPLQKIIMIDRGQQCEFLLGLLGEHNAYNAAAAIIAARCSGIENPASLPILASFQGVGRRLERVGFVNGALVIDDYAHHPAEIRATLRALRTAYGKRSITAVFQPHTFSRTRALLEEFAQSFDDAQRVIVVEIYGSAREKEGIISSRDLVAHINRYRPHVAVYAAHHAEAATALRKASLGEEDIIVTMGAGDVAVVAHDLCLKKPTSRQTDLPTVTSGIPVQ